MQAAAPSTDEVRAELRQAVEETRRRGLLHASRWAAEQLQGLPAAGGAAPLPTALAPESDSMLLARSYYDVNEYRRCARVLEMAMANDEAMQSNGTARFLSMYSIFLAGEKRKEEESLELSSGEEDGGADGDVLGRRTVVNRELRALHTELSAICGAGGEAESDGFLLYMHGLVLVGLDQKGEAREVLAAATRAYPCNWAAWKELQQLLTEVDSLANLQLPAHWTAALFGAEVEGELQQHETDGSALFEPLDAIFPRSTYLLAQRALGAYHFRDYEAAGPLFEELHTQDPYRLDQMDAYSNILFVHEEDAKLAYLAKEAVQNDKYRPETCCIIANYYSRKDEHEKAVVYFSRALQLDPNYLSACTLMGHEYVEMKNHPAAIRAYRKAVDINPRDYRAWYGLGQMYEILQMPFYALYYYRKVTLLRRHDPRMWVALGKCFSSLVDESKTHKAGLSEQQVTGRTRDAIKCFERAEANDDSEGIAVVELAQLTEKLGRDDPAQYQRAAIYHSLVLERGIDAEFADAKAHDFLAKRELKLPAPNLDEAEAHCRALLEAFGSLGTQGDDEVRQLVLDARAHLKEIGAMREGGAMHA